MKLVITVEEDEYGELERIEGRVNDRRIFLGHYGGEPEDNRESRGYSWVIPAIKRVAALGGIEVEYVQREPGEEE